MQGNLVGEALARANAELEKVKKLAAGLAKVVAASRAKLATEEAALATAQRDQAKIEGFIEALKGIPK